MSAIKEHNSTDKNSFHKHKGKAILFATIAAASMLIFAAIAAPTTIINQAYAAQHVKPPALAMMNSGPAPSIDNFNISDGYTIEPVMWNMSLPTALTWDDQGNMYIAQSGFAEWLYDNPKIIKVDQSGNASILVDRFIYPPVTDIEFHEGKLYVSSKGVVSTVDPVTGLVKDIMIGLPSSGDHQNDQLAFGPDGRIYVTLGTATNSAIVGMDNILALQWPKYVPQFHDTPGKNVTLTGKNYVTPNPFTADPNDNATTGAYMPFGVPSQEGQVVKGSPLCNGCIISANLDGSDVQLVAWGLRNPYGIAFTGDGKLVVSNNGADERGSRSIANDPDKVYVIDVSNPENMGKFYGWPDFGGNGEPVTDEKFKSARANQTTELLIQNPPPVEKPLAMVNDGPSLTQVDISTSEQFGHVGMAFIGSSGTFTPITHEPNTVEEQVVGHNILMLDPATGNYSKFISVKRYPDVFTPVGVAFNPEGNTMYIADIGRLEIRDTLPNGTPLPMTATWPYLGSGVIWKVTKTSSSAAETLPAVEGGQTTPIGNQTR